jgi:6-phosphofructokinase 1
MSKTTMEWAIDKLGEATIDSPLNTTIFVDEESFHVLDFSSKIPERDRALLEVSGDCCMNVCSTHLIFFAGPRRKLFFEPENTTVGIVTCGGLSPGLNNVIRGIVLCLWHRYGVKKFLGLRFGYEGTSFFKEKLK